MKIPKEDTEYPENKSSIYENICDVTVNMEMETELNGWA